MTNMSLDRAGGTSQPKVQRLTVPSTLNAEMAIGDERARVPHLASQMPIWDAFMVPVLRVLQNGETLTTSDLYQVVADQVGLTSEQRREMLNSGQLRYRNRIGWALSSLALAGGLLRPRRGFYSITDLGRELLAEHSNGLREEHLKSIATYTDRPQKVRSAKVVSTSPQSQTDAGIAAAASALDPLEEIDSGVQRLHADVAAQLLDRLRAAKPEFLEQSVLDVLVAMGYGGVEQRARRIGGSGDGGVDGVIDQDPLGLARIYVQAKRYAPDNIVGRPQIQGFVGALHGQQASQGIFITTSGFSREAVEYARTVSASVVLVDGIRLASLMITYGVGVQPVQTYTVVAVDEDYFE